MTCLFLEIKVILHARELSALTPTMEAALSLCFPFQYCHFYCPVLPKILIDYTQAPIPFFIGCTSDWIEPMLKTLPDDVFEPILFFI